MLFALRIKNLSEITLPVLRVFDTVESLFTEECVYVFFFFVFFLGGGGALAQSVERRTLGEKILGSIPAVAARSLVVGSVSVKCDRLRQKSLSPRSASVWQHVKLSDVSLLTRSIYSLAVDEGIKKPNKLYLRFP